MILPILLFLQVAGARGPLPEVVTRPRLDRNGGVDFHALVVPDTVYVGQQATYQLGVFLDQEIRGRLRHNPEFIPPESRAMLSYDLPDPGGTVSVNRDGRAYEVHVFRRALFPLTPGRYTIAPARLAYTLPQGQSFFSREESFALRSEEVTLVVIDAPMAGRPPDWSGAVGVWKANAHVDTSRDRAGDALVLTLRVEGTGNVTLLPRPPLAISWATVVPADERVKLDSTPTAMRGFKEFDWLVTPRTGGAQRVPPVRLAYFNPFTKRFETAASEPFTVQVAPGFVVAADSTLPPPPPPEQPLTLRPVLGDEVPPPLGDLAMVRWLLLVAPLIAFVAWLAKRPRRAKTPATSAAQLRALAAPSARDVAAADVRAALLGAIQRRTGLTAASLTQHGAWLHALRLEGVTDETATDFESFLDQLDAAVFGGAGGGSSPFAARANDLFVRIDREARRGRVSRTQAMAAAGGGRVALFIMIVASAGALFARDVERAREPFARGIVAYAGASYMRAARLFEDAAHAAPRVPATWANAGTAAWAAGDTAGAVVGWQRALRLDPMADDLRDRLARVPAPQDFGVARVPAIPARAPSALALLLWVGGWGIVASRFWRRRPTFRLIIATLVIAGLAGVGARLFEDRLEGRDLAVIVDPGPLRALPVLGAEAGPIPMAGEVARVVQRQGVWTRLALDGDREGWIATERLAPLGGGRD